MPVRGSIFGSAAERKHYKELSRRWERYTIYPNLPVLQIVDVRPGDPLVDFGNREDVFPPFVALSEGQFRQLKGASVDFVLCDDQDRPLVGVEFDGFGGESRLSSYVEGQGRGEISSYILSLKLKVLHGQGFVYVVVNDEHFANVSEPEGFSVVDAVIGRALAAHRTRQGLHRINPKAGGFDVEITSLLEEDPLSRALADLQTRVPVRTTTLSEHTRPRITGATSPQRLRERWTVRQVGAKCTLDTPDQGRVVEEVWLASCPLVDVESIARDLAQLKALQRLERLRGPAHRS